MLSTWYPCIYFFKGSFQSKCVLIFTASICYICTVWITRRGWTSTHRLWVVVCSAKIFLVNTGVVRGWCEWQSQPLHHGKCRRHTNEAGRLLVDMRDERCISGLHASSWSSRAAPLVIIDLSLYDYTSQTRASRRMRPWLDSERGTQCAGVLHKPKQGFVSSFLPDAATYIL